MTALSRTPKIATTKFGPGLHRPGHAKPAARRPTATRRDTLLGSLCPCCCGLCKPKDGWYDKFFANAMATGMGSYEEAVAPFKFKLLQNIPTDKPGQRVLEVGIGAGPNLRYLTNPTLPQDPKLQVVGVDPNPYMFDYAKSNAQAAGIEGNALDLRIGVAEDLPVEDASFDTIICTLVLCSVPDVTASVAEMRRALKPGGRLLFLEHVFAPPEKPLLRFSQRVLNPLQQLLADGCHLDRNPVPAFEAAGFASLEVSAFTVPGMGPIGPHVSGIATA